MRLSPLYTTPEGARECVPRFVEKERRPPLRHQGIRSGGNLRVFENLAQTLVAVDASDVSRGSWKKNGVLCLLFIHPPAHGSEVSPAARNTLDSARIPRASKLLICGLFQKVRVLAQDGVESPAMGKVRAIPKVGGLHHYYTRHAACLSRSARDGYGTSRQLTPIPLSRADADPRNVLHEDDPRILVAGSSLISRSSSLWKGHPGAPRPAGSKYDSVSVFGRRIPVNCQARALSRCQSTFARFLTKRK